MICAKPGKERFLSKEVIAAFSMTAPRERILERIRELEAARTDEIAFCLPDDGARERIEELGRDRVAPLALHARAHSRISEAQARCQAVERLA